MFENRFAHFLSYGATDQRTVRELAGDYNGLLVPGTVAAFQREGTGGFVLTLSATTEGPQYAIDPRFPLFQQALTRPKRSHVALAELLGVPELVRPTDPSPADFTDDIIETVARNWATFNGDYQAAAGSKFEKYARRLGQDVRPHDAKAPSYVMPPYLVAGPPPDPWWDVSQRLYEATSNALNDDGRCVRVIAARNVGALAPLTLAVSENRAAIWVSGLEELTRPASDLTEYALAIRESKQRNLQVFALYGGFFSIMLQNLGLSGSSHGIGYGEYRNWIELPESGPPPARYYLPHLHRYVQADEAARLYFTDRRLAECECAECNGEPPVGLDYHALMRHSVRCRAREIAEWRDLGTPEMVERLGREWAAFLAILHGSDLPEVAIARYERLGSHMSTWATALENTAP